MTERRFEQELERQTQSPRFEEFLAELGERGVRFRDRRQRGVRASGLVRTLGGDAIVDAWNSSQIALGQEIGCPGVEVRDALYGDTDEPCMRADGQLWSLAHAMANKKEHPNCTREFTLMEPGDARVLDVE